MDGLFQTFLADPAGFAGHLLGQGFKGAGPLAVALIAMLLAGNLAVAPARPQRDAPMSRPRRAFGQSEGLLWSRITTALPGHVVLMSVPLTRFITVRQAGGLGRNQRKLEALVVDFGVFRADGTVSSVVLLDGKEPALTPPAAEAAPQTAGAGGHQGRQLGLNPLALGRHDLPAIEPRAGAVRRGRTGQGAAARSRRGQTMRSDRTPGLRPGTRRPDVQAGVTSFSPTMPATISPRLISRPALAGSPSRTIPSTAADRAHSRPHRIRGPHRQSLHREAEQGDAQDHGQHRADGRPQAG